MTDGAAALLTAVDFVAPAVVIWLFVLRRSESLLSSFLAIAGLSAFLVPTLTFLLNRTIGYPLDRLGLTGLAAVLVLGSIAWSKVTLPGLGPLKKFALRIGEIVGDPTPLDANGRTRQPQETSTVLPSNWVSNVCGLLRLNTTRVRLPACTILTLRSAGSPISWALRPSPLPVSGKSCWECRAHRESPRTLVLCVVAPRSHHSTE